jgi:hypothetical protein
MSRDDDVESTEHRRAFLVGCGLAVLALTSALAALLTFRGRVDLGWVLAVNAAVGALAGGAFLGRSY